MQGRLAEFREHATDGLKAMYKLEEFLRGSTVPWNVLELIRIRVSQINGCGFCVDMHSKEAKSVGETDERLFAIAAWREAPYFTDAERAALELAEAATRIGDSPHGVSDEVWAAAREHFDEYGLSVLIMTIASINAWNRINVTNRTVAGSVVR